MDPFQFPSFSRDVHGLGTEMMLRELQPIDRMRRGSWFVIFGI
jgi:hypothetical protein